jgi:glycosyltransferase involved in cell wall biosynthesis
MRIALIITPLDVKGGGPRQALMLARELGKLGEEVTLFTPALDREKCYPELLDGLDIKVVRPGPLLGRFADGANALFLDALGRVTMLPIARAITSDFDLINCHDQTGSWPAAKAKERLGTPAVWMCNDPPLWYHELQHRRPWQRRLRAAGLETLDPEAVFLKLADQAAARLMDRIVVLDKKNSERVSRIYGLPTTIVRSGVDARFFAGLPRDKAREKLGMGPSDFVMLHVGYAAPWKGQFEAIRALKELEPNVPGARLVCVGSAVSRFCGPLVGELGLRSKVRLMEGVSDDTLAALYAGCDVLLYPADETWGLNVTEAMAAGRPVVVSDRAGVSEVIENGRTGFVVRHGEVGEIVARLRELIDDPQRAARMGKEGRHFAETELKWENYARGMLKVFWQVLHERRRP